MAVSSMGQLIAQLLAAPAQRRDLTTHGGVLRYRVHLHDGADYGAVGVQVVTLPARGSRQSMRRG